MTDVEKVALWAGLISSIVGIVLSIVAIVLSIVSNNRATAVNDQTIKSLQKIESAVERLADDSRTLIKAGWDKMLGNFGQRGEAEACETEELTQIEEPVAPLVTTPTVMPAAGADTTAFVAERFIELERKIDSLRSSMNSKSATGERKNSASRSVDILTRQLNDLSPRAQALFDLISRSRHLTTPQFEKLRQSDLGPELGELLQAGLLERLQGHGSDSDLPVYWLPSQFARVARVAIQLAARVRPELADSVTAELKKIGYPMLS